mmetsp:Transcript_25866/g.83772  ORF Transcript_25866/g.83772 Transcript_25866/m.83772 type:complete len:209 (-) Transcript_25866:1380-2006(-)
MFQGRRRNGPASVRLAVGGDDDGFRWRRPEAGGSGEDGAERPVVDALRDAPEETGAQDERPTLLHAVLPSAAGVRRDAALRARLGPVVRRRLRPPGPRVAGGRLGLAVGLLRQDGVRRHLQDHVRQKPTARPSKEPRDPRGTRGHGRQEGIRALRRTQGRRRLRRALQRGLRRRPARGNRRRLRTNHTGQTLAPRHGREGRHPAPSTK